MVVMPVSGELGSSGKHIHCHSMGKKPRHVQGQWHSAQAPMKPVTNKELYAEFLSCTISHKTLPVHTLPWRTPIRRQRLWFSQVCLTKLKCAFLSGTAACDAEGTSAWKRDGWGEISQMPIQSQVAWEGWLRNDCLNFYPLQRPAGKK